MTSFIEKKSDDEGFCHRIGITVDRGATVFKVTLLLLADGPGNAEAGATAGHTRRNVVDFGGFTESSQALGIVQPPGSEAQM